MDWVRNLECFVFWFPTLTSHVSVYIWVPDNTVLFQEGSLLASKKKLGQNAKCIFRDSDHMNASLSLWCAALFPVLLSPKCFLLEFLNLSTIDILQWKLLLTASYRVSGSNAALSAPDASATHLSVAIRMSPNVIKCHRRKPGTTILACVPTGF